MALKKIVRKELKIGGGLKTMAKLDPDAIKKRREMAKALDFVPPAGSDALADITEDLSPEAETEEIIAKLDSALNPEKQAALKADLDRQKDAYKNQGATDYYFVAVFADSTAASAFLKAANYGNPDAVFVDGHLLAGALNIDLPKPEFKLQKIRPPVRNLEQLVTAFPKTPE